MEGVKEPTRSRCAPGDSHAPSTRGSQESVAQEIRSLARTAASRSVTASMRFPVRSDSEAFKCSTRFAALACVRFQTSTFWSDGRTVRCALMRCGASAPAPTMSSTLEFLRARRDGE